ncbi:VapE domain-containing protein [Streptococcus pasteurianus]|uniref:VapE domain-containing protein n=1 Tax=Streptococcus pasteurianus TaxID=197614 RepID=UPI0036F1E29F
MSEFLEQLDEIVPDDSGKVINLANEQLKRDSNGNVKKTRNNLSLLFRGADKRLDKLFKYNEATKNVEVTRNQELSDYITVNHGLLSDDTIRQLWAYLSEEWGLEYKENDIVNIVKVVALNQRYNPIKIMLEKAKVMARPVDPFTVIQKYINIEDNQYNRLVFDLVFRGAIARVFSPGIQFDYCLDLVGKQGTGKTTFLREIFKGFYGEISSYTEKDDLLKMLELWAVNDDELVASNKVSFNDLKRTITMREIKVRPPYDRTTVTFPVDFIFTRTTNDTGHLKDSTGDRRFLGVEVLERQEGQLNQISEQDLIDIWGNYYKAYETNSKLYYDETSEEGKLIARERAKYKYQDDIIEKLEWYLSIKIPEDFYKPTTKKHERKQYYTDMEELGVAYKNNSDREAGTEWVGIIERDRLNINDVLYEIFNEDPEPQTKIKAKIKMYMNNLDRWEYKKKLKFGKRMTSGFVKK